MHPLHVGWVTHQSLGWGISKGLILPLKTGRVGSCFYACETGLMPPKLTSAWW